MHHLDTLGSKKSDLQIISILLFALYVHVHGDTFESQQGNGKNNFRVCRQCQRSPRCLGGDTKLFQAGPQAPGHVPAPPSGYGYEQSEFSASHLRVWELASWLGTLLQYPASCLCLTDWK